MGSRTIKIALITVLFMILAVTAIVLYTNRSSLQFMKGSEQGSVSGDHAQSASGQRRVGDDTRAFLEDETFFNSDKDLAAAVRKKEENRLSLLMTSVQKDLRVQVVDNSGNPVAGVPFTVVLDQDKEYVDTDQDGIIYIEFLRAGLYDVLLKEAEGFQVPEAPSQIEVKQSVEYAVIDDISLLIFTEEDVDPAIEDLEVREAKEDADKSEITGLREGNANAKIGIDVSKWNKEIDWDKVKSAGIEFAVIRIGYRGAATGALVVDPYFESNIKGAKQAGIPVGVYFFTQAISPVEAVEEASMVVSMIKDYDITYPVFIDTEGAGGSGRADLLDVDTRTAVCQAFCTTVENEGFKAGVYAGRNWMNEKLDMSKLESFTTWLAEYRDVPLYQGYYHMWQYTSKGKVDGIEGNVDLNLSYLKLDEPGETEGDAAQPDTENTQEPGAENAKESEIVEPKPIQGVEDADW